VQQTQQVKHKSNVCGDGDDDCDNEDYDNDDDNENRKVFSQLT
jgi:hypothetical protein